MMEKVRFGVIGLGGMGQGHLRSIKEVQEAELTAVSDVDAEINKKISEEYGVPGFTNYEELLESKLVDAVLIATPHYFHPEIGIAAMRRGIHCLSEKPIAVSVSDADRFVEEAQRSGVVFSVMYQQRTLPQVRLARKIMESGRLGQIRRTCMIEPNYRSQAYYDSATWRATWKGEGGGVLINQAPYGIDLFLLLGCMPSRVTAKVRTRLHNIEVEDEATALLEYPNGAWGYYYTTTNEAPHTSFMEICGDNGKMVYQGGLLKLYSLKTSIPEFTFSTKEMWASPEVVEEKLELPQCETGHKEIIRNFCRSILFKEELIAPGEQGIWSVEFINALILSGKKGKPVDIPVDREEYEELLNGLKKISRERKIKKVQRITDPHHLRK
ncbi:gfo/Idh/MocA family oxidoreductase [Candidatus Aerophobetes bacterium]|uniref:Gfo/Idh/MocA family oxidoreductase n=1 Tax=Aerophobetes bacterium TaxID=2030807 RepID=A0A497E1U7_UNCAE|nr:MAG: gfo/Idh/MocA family oxidoreductase [Candidatus Aerophobetes bacterium]